MEEEITKKKFFILDGSSLLFRAFFALPLLTTSTGIFTNAIHGFSKMLAKLLNDYQPDLLAVAFDKSRKTFRTDLYDAYKGTRGKTPEEFSVQVPILKEFLATFGISLLEIDGYEADDILGTLAKKASETGSYESYIVTGDRDAFQLIRDDVKVLYTKKGISEMLLMDEGAFLEEYGFTPRRLIDFKALMGDKSDNIPGVTGIGEKTAQKLIIAYGSLDEVFAHASEIKGKKIRENLAKDRELALLSQRLATIVEDVPLDFKSEDYEIKPILPSFQAFCDKYELHSVKRLYSNLFQLEGTASEDTKNQPITYTKIKTLSTWESVKESILATKSCAFIGLYTGKVPHLALESLALAVKDDIFLLQSDCLNMLDVVEFLSDADVELTTYDVKSFYHVGGTHNPRFFDVALVAYLLDPSPRAVELPNIYERYGDGAFSFTLPAQGEELLAQKVQLVQALKKPLLVELESTSMLSLYQDIELSLVEVLASMEEAGIYVNKDSLKTQEESIGQRLQKVEEEIYSLVGEQININSPKQLAHLLFETLSLPAQKKTKTGYSTDVEVLESLRPLHPIIEKILLYRQLSKLKSTYLDGMLVLIDKDTERIHTTFNQMVTATGRLSSSDPNLQNIPVRTEEGREIRRLFEVGEGYDVLLSADYSQIELRVLAHLSEDANFIDAFRKGQDIHARTAAEVFGVSLSEVTSELRRRAKAVNFGIVYGISDYGLAKDLDITRKEAASYIKDYFLKCSGVKKFIDEIVAQAQQDGYVKTLFGRRRQLTNIKSSNFHERSLAERMAMNTPIQGTAADIIKIAMIDVYRALKERKLKSRILLQVHDELILEVPQEEIVEVTELLREKMEKVLELKVPLKIDCAYGKNWAEAK